MTMSIVINLVNGSGMVQCMEKLCHYNPLLMFTMPYEFLTIMVKSDQVLTQQVNKIKRGKSAHPHQANMLLQNRLKSSKNNNMESHKSSTLVQRNIVIQPIVSKPQSAAILAKQVSTGYHRHNSLRK